MASILYPDLSGNGKGVLDLPQPMGTQGEIGATGLGAVQGASAIINANKRGEPYAMGWGGITTKETYTRTVTQSEQFASEYYTTLRGPKYSVTTDGTPYPRFAFTYPVPHNLIAGDRIEVTGASDVGYNGTRIVYSVIDDLTIYVDYGGAVLGSSAGIRVANFGTVFNATDEIIRYSFPREGMNVAASQNWGRGAQFVRDSVRAYDFAGGRFTYEFMIRDDQVELMFPSGGSFDVWVDGSLLSLTSFTMSGGYPLTFNKFVFGSKRLKHIRVQCENTQCAGIAVRERTNLFSVTGPRKLRAAFLSDSFGEGIGGTTPKFGFLALLCQRQGWDLANLSVGGTGINTDGGGSLGKKKYIDRVSELQAYDPDIVVIDNSINSIGTLALLDCADLITAIKIAAPHARIIGFGRRWPTYLPTPATLSDDVTFRAACLLNSVSFVDGGIGAHGLAPWLTLNNQNTYYNGVQATATSALTGAVVTGTTITNIGDGYDFFGSYPVTVTGGGGTGAAITANWNTEVTSVQVLNGGFGYTVAPTVVIESGATGVVNRDGATAISSVTITNSGGGYTTPPVVTFTGGAGAGAAATAVLSNGRVVAVTVTNAGAGYTSDPTVTISESTTKATGTALISGGKVTGVTITSKGSFYNSIPRVRFVPDVTGGQGAIAVAHVTNKLNSLTITNGGTGYTTAPTITIGHPTGGDPTHPKNMGHIMLAERYGAGVDNL